jgi:cytoskeletal protein CcmA (bactofilin family)
MAMFDGGKTGDISKETIIGADVTVTGNLKSSANVQINGNVKGKVETANDILVGETATIDGSMKAKNIIVTGTIKGNLEIAEDLEISPTGKVFGDVITKNLIIKKGSVFVGKTTMPETEPPVSEIVEAESAEETEPSIEPNEEEKEEEEEGLLDKLVTEKDNQAVDEK